jgi:ATP-dependent DNA helicase RecG
MAATISRGDVHMLSLREGQEVEFKREWSDKALEDVAAFANANGGTLYLGIADSGESVGFTLTDKDEQKIASQILNHLRILPTIRRTTVQGHEIIEITTYQAGSLVSYNGKFLHRVGCTNREIPQEELLRRLAERSAMSWDGLLSPEATIEDIDEGTVRHFVELAGDSLRAAEGEACNVILEKLDLLRGGQLTNAAVLLFGKNPQRFFPMAGIQIGRFKDESSSIISSRMRTGNLFQQLDQIHGQDLKDYLHIEFAFEAAGEGLEGLQRIEKWEYPRVALREALVNALVHRDYFQPGHVAIRVYDDRLEIWSPGRLPDGVDVGDLRKNPHPSRPRNPLVARVWHSAALIEKWGTGTLRMIEECRVNGLPEPVFEEQGGGVRVVFRKDIFSHEVLVRHGLAERQIKAVLHVKARQRITNSEYQQIAGVAKRTATRDLEELVEKGILVRRGEGRGTHYLLSSGLNKN